MPFVSKRAKSSLQGSVQALWSWQWRWPRMWTLAMTTPPCPPPPQICRSRSLLHVPAPPEFVTGAYLIKQSAWAVHSALNPLDGGPRRGSLFHPGSLRHLAWEWQRGFTLVFIFFSEFGSSLLAYNPCWITILIQLLVYNNNVTC